MREWSNIKAVYHKFYNTRRPPAGAHSIATTTAARLSACELILTLPRTRTRRTTQG
jgi:hypothetical protein